jgi:hypothetical protein
LRHKVATPACAQVRSQSLKSSKGQEGLLSQVVRHTRPNANELNPAQTGSALLSQLAVVSSYATWLSPLRMVGMAFLFTGITLALTVIIGTLRLQAAMLLKFYQQASSQG